MEVAWVVEKYTACHPLAERVTETIDTGEVIEDDCTTGDCPLCHHLERGSGRTVIVSVDEAKYKDLLLQARRRIDDIAPVRSAWSALPALPLVGFSKPPPEPGVPVSPAPGSPQVQVGGWLS
jgi:hypothetical protein